jgi:quercetin dioxygenase-like cupin family protein
MSTTTKTCQAKSNAHPVLSPGAEAPGFTLRRTPDRWVSLSEFRGRPVILAFYPADWSPVCGDQMASRFLKQQKPMFVLAFLIISTLITTSTLMAQKAVASPLAQETITELMSKDLAGFPDKEVLMYTVDFPPGFSSPVHRHEAQVSVYVLEGSVVMQVRGGEEVTLQPGQTFYENPKDVHVVSRNASSTKPAKFLVFLIHKKGTPLVMPAT